jgi:hypothetical protein
MSITWLKLDHGIITDVKLRRFNAAEKWAWITILCLASQNEENRGLVKEDIEDVADLCDYDTQDFRYLLDKFKIKGMIDLSISGILILNWDKRQHTKPSDLPEATRKRKAKQRANSKAKVNEMSRDVTPPVTPAVRDVTRSLSRDPDPDTDPDPETDPETEKKETPNPLNRNPETESDSIPVPQVDFPEPTEPEPEFIEAELLEDSSYEAVSANNPSSTLTILGSEPNVPPRSSESHAAAKAKMQPVDTLRTQFSGTSSSAPDWMRFKGIYQRFANLVGASFGAVPKAQMAWSEVEPEIDGDFWNGLDAYIAQKSRQFAKNGKAIGVLGAANWLLGREWTNALAAEEMQREAKSQGLDLETPQSVKSAALLAHNMEMSKRVLAARKQRLENANA